MSRARDIANYGDGIDTSSITSGTFADARIAQSNVTQHESAIDALGTVTSGTFNGTIGGSATFPSGSILKSTSNYTTTYTVVTTAYNDSPTNFVAVLASDTFTVKSASSSILVFASLNIEFKGGTSCYVRITESTTGLSQVLNDYLARNSNTSSTPCFQYEHSHGQSAGTSLTYTMSLALRVSNSNGVRLNDHFTTNQNRSTISTFEIA